MRWHVRLLTLLIFTAGIATAYPTLTGPTGLITVPTGELPNSGIHLAADIQKLERGRAAPLRAQVVLGHGIEFGALLNPFSNDAPLDTATGANVKIALPVDDGVRLGVGAQMLRLETFSGKTTEYWQGYFAWTTDFNPEFFDASNLTLTVGGNWTSVNPSDGSSVDAIRGFLGAEIRLLESLNLLVEYQSAERGIGDEEPILSMGGRFRMGDNIFIQGGVTNAQGLVGGPSANLFLGASLLLATPSD